MGIAASLDEAGLVEGRIRIAVETLAAYDAEEAFWIKRSSR